MNTHEGQVALKTKLWNDHIARCEAMQARVDKQLAAELMLPLVPFAWILVGLLAVAIWIIDRDCWDDWLEIV